MSVWISAVLLFTTQPGDGHMHWSVYTAAHATKEACTAFVAKQQAELTKAYPAGSVSVGDHPCSRLIVRPD